MNTLLLLSQVLGLVSFIALIWLVIRAFNKHILWGFVVLLLSPISALIFGIKYWRDEKAPFLAYITSSVAAVALGLYVFTAWGGWDLVRASMQLQQGIQAETLSGQDADRFINANLNFIENAVTDPQERKKLALIRKINDRMAADLSGAERLELDSEIQELMQDEELGTEQYRQLEEMRSELQRDTSSATAASESQTSVAPEAPVRKSSYTPRKQRVGYVPIELADAGKYVGKSFKVKRRNGIEQDVILKGVSPGRLQFEQRTRGGTFSFNYRSHDIAQLKLLQWQPY